MPSINNSTLNQSIELISSKPQFNPKNCVFYLDLSDNGLLPKIMRYIIHHGGQCATFLDRTVTHMITDKAASHVDNYLRAQQWAITIWSIEEFATTMLQYMEGKHGIRTAAAAAAVTTTTISNNLTAIAATTTAVTASPTNLIRNSRKRDLSAFLQDERRSLQQIRSGTSALFGRPSTTTIAAAVRVIEAHFGSSVGSSGNKELQVPRASFHEFVHPFVMFSELTCMYAPVYKEYAPTNGQAKHPVFYSVCLDGSAAHAQTCPFVCPPAHAQISQQKTITASYLGKKTTTSGMLTRSKAAKMRLLTNNNAMEKYKPTQKIVTQQHPKVPIKESSNHLKNDKENIGPPLDNDEDGNEKIVQTTAIVNPLLSKPNTVSREISAPSNQMKRPRPGYCECCYEKYNELDKHVRGMLHRQYALEDANYKAVDDLLVFMQRPPIVPPWESRPKQSAPEQPRSPLSPISNNSSTAAVLAAASSMLIANLPRNYTSNKRLKQNQAMKQLNLLTSTGPIDSEMLPSSPSLKRKRSQKSLVAS